MALVNYMGSGLGLLGIGNVNYADLSTLGRQPAAARTKGPETATVKDQEFPGFRGDAQHLSDNNLDFQTEYKKALSNYGNDPEFFHGTQEYTDLVDKYQRNTVGNRAAATTTEKQGESFRAHINTKGNGTSSRQLMMQFDDNSQSWVPQISERTSDFTTKGQWLWDTQQYANVDQDGNLVTPDFDWQVGDLNTVREEFSKELNDAGHRLRSGATKKIDKYESGDRSEGTDISIKNTYNHTWSHKNNIDELTSAADMLSRDITDETEYAMAQEVYQLARSEEKAWYPVFEVNEKGENVFKVKDGRIQFEKIDLEPDEIMDPAFMKHASRFEPLRHVQNMKRTRQIREDSDTTDNRYEENKGYAYGSGGGDDEEGDQLFTMIENGIYSPAAERPSKIIVQRNGTPVTVKETIRRRDVNNAPGPDFLAASEAIFGKRVGELISTIDPQILIGNKWNNMKNANGVLNETTLNGLAIVDLISAGEQIGPDGKTIVRTLKVRLMADEDFLEQYNLEGYDADGQPQNITDSWAGIDYITTEVQHLTNIEYFSDVDKISVKTKEGLRKPQELNQMHPGEGWTIFTDDQGRSAYVFEAEFMIDDFRQYDKWITEATKVRTQELQEKQGNLEIERDRAQRRRDMNQQNIGADIVNALGEKAGTNDAGNYARTEPGDGVRSYSYRNMDNELKQKKGT